MAFIIDNISQIIHSDTGGDTPGKFLYRTEDSKATVAAADYFVEGKVRVRDASTTFKNSSHTIRYIDKFKLSDVIEVQRVNTSDVTQETFTLIISAIDYSGTSPSISVTEFDESGDVNGPASSTDNAAVRFDGTTGTLLQDSSVLISDADAISGVTALDVDNIKLDGNTISSKDTDGDLVFDPNGSGNVDVNSSAIKGATSVEIADTGDIQDASGNEYLAFSSTASAVNELTVTNAATGNAPSITATGGDTNIDIALTPKGTGVFDLSGSTEAFRVPTGTTAQRPSSPSAGYVRFNTTTGSHEAYDGSAWVTSGDVSGPGSSTNNALVRWDGASGDTLQDSSIIVDDSDNVSGMNALSFADAKGITDANSNEALIFQTTASAVNHIDVTNAATGNAPSISAVGDDANVSLSITPKGTGVVDFSGSTEAFYIPTGTTAQRPSSPSAGYVRFNTTTGSHEAYDGSAWVTTGDVSGPASSTDNTIPRFDSTTGKVIQGSSVLINDSDAVSGVTSLDVDNIKIDGNTISATNTNGSLVLTPNGTGVSDMSGSTEALHIPTGTTAQRPSSPSAGYVRFNTTTGSHEAYDGSAWVTTGDVSGPASSTDNTVPRFDSTTGKVIQGSSVVVDDSDNVSGMNALSFADAKGITDANGNEALIFQTTASAVNHLDVTNAATTSGPEIAAVGDDTNIDLTLTPKGSGNLVLDGLSFPNADGAANQLIGTTGAGALTFRYGGWERISSSTASSSATIDFTGLSSTYHAYMVVLSNVVAATTGQRLYMRTSTDNGTSYDSGASDYAFGAMAVLCASGPTVTGYGDDAHTEIHLSTTTVMDNAASVGLSGNVILYDHSAANYTQITYDTVYRTTTSSQLETSRGAAQRSATEDVDAIRFYFSSGDISTGTFTLYGLIA